MTDQEALQFTLKALRQIKKADDIDRARFMAKKVLSLVRKNKKATKFVPLEELIEMWNWAVLNEVPEKSISRQEIFARSIQMYHNIYEE